MNKDVVPLVTDLLQGDDSIINREDYNEISLNEIQEAIKLIVSNPILSERDKQYLLLNTHKVVYKERPPTIEEFLTEEWLGPTAETVRPWVRDALIQMFQPNSKYKNAILFSATRTGKSYLTVLSNLYVAIHIYYMRNPKRFFNVSPSTVLTQMFVSFSIDKVKELLIEPMQNIMKNSPKFLQSRTLDAMQKRGKESSRICWTTAGDTNVMTMGENVNMKVASDSAKLLGLPLIMASMSELTFFKERGYSDEKILRVYNAAKNRVHNSFPGIFLAKSILDSSPNDATYETSLDYWIVNKASKNPDNLVIRGSRWEMVPDSAPIWKRTGQTFPVYLGSGGKPARVVKEGELSAFDLRDILHVPIDLKTEFEDDLLWSLKDSAGIPSGNPDRLIYDLTKIEEIFDPRLINHYTYFVVTEEMPPEDILWEYIRDIYFVKTGKDTYQFWRNPHEQRFLAFDAGLTKDSFSIALSHPEIKKDGSIIYITDMTIVLIPNGGRINLDAPKFLVEKLIKKGGMKIKHGAYDSFQSDSTMQFLNRLGVDMEKLSVMNSTEPYLGLVQLINSGRYKCGKNLFLKNNLKSLKYSKTKGGRALIDHEIGKFGNTVGLSEDWESSPYGIFGKDASDAVCGSIELCKIHYKGVPRYIWEDYVEPTLDQLKEKDYTLGSKLSSLGLALKGR